MAQKKAAAKAKPKAATKVKAKAVSKTKAKPKPAAKAKPAKKPAKLKDFLVGVSKDPKQLEKFKADPSGTMKKAGLSKKDMDVVMTRDGNKVRKHLGDDYPPGCIVLL
jgi:hypothetical protein